MQKRVGNLKKRREERRLCSPSLVAGVDEPASSSTGAEEEKRGPSLPSNERRPPTDVLSPSFGNGKKERWPLPTAMGGPLVAEEGC